MAETRLPRNPKPQEWLAKIIHYNILQTISPSILLTGKGSGVVYMLVDAFLTVPDAITRRRRISLWTAIYPGFRRPDYRRPFAELCSRIDFIGWRTIP